MKKAWEDERGVKLAEEIWGDLIVQSMPGINLYSLKLQTDFTTGGRSETAFFSLPMSHQFSMAVSQQLAF